jgi:hypothetical protein
MEKFMEQLVLFIFANTFFEGGTPMSVSRKESLVSQFDIRGNKKEQENQMDNLFLGFFSTNDCKVDEKIMTNLYLARGGIWTSSEAAAVSILLLNKMSNAEQPSKEAVSKQPEKDEAGPQQSNQQETSNVVSMEDKPLEHPPLLFDKVVCQGRNNLVFSPGGVG